MQEPLLNQRHWFDPLAERMGPAYLRYAFARGTGREVDAMMGWLGLGASSRVLDVGCGPGRHAGVLAERGCDVVGVDISERFVHVAAEQGKGSFVLADAARLPFTGVFDAAISVCQGAFGMAGGPPDHARHASALDPDGEVLAEVVRAVRPGGRVLLTAFSAYFQVRFLEASDSFDAGRGVNHESTEIHDPDGNRHPAELWTSCFTPRELRLLARDSGLEVDALWSVAPGDWSQRPPGLDRPEFLVLGTRRR